MSNRVRSGFGERRAEKHHVPFASGRGERFIQCCKRGSSTLGKLEVRGIVGRESAFFGDAARMRPRRSAIKSAFEVSAAHDVVLDAGSVGELPKRLSPSVPWIATRIRPYTRSAWGAFRFGQQHDEVVVGPVVVVVLAGDPAPARSREDLVCRKRPRGERPL